MSRVRLDIASAAWALARRWGPVFAEFVTIQAATQLCVIASGLIIVRLLDKQEYALYIIGNMWLSALVALSSSGVGDAAMAIGGRMWQDRARLGQVVSTSLGMRRWLAVAALPPIVALAAWTLAQNGASAGTVALIVLLLMAGAACQMSYGLYLVVLRLRAEIRRIQCLDLGAAALRLLLTTGAAFFYLDAPSAILIGVIMYFAQYRVGRRWVGALVDLGAPRDEQMRGEIRRVVKRQWLNEVNGVFQGQVSVLLLSFFGTSAAVADLGALGRISVVFSIFAVAMLSIVVPRYARCQEPSRLRRLYIQIMLGYTVLTGIPVVFAVLFPEPILWVLGPKYAHLSYELALMALSTAIASINGLAWMLNSARAWILPGWIAVPLGLAIQVALMAVIGVSTLVDVLTFGIASSTANILINIAVTVVCIRQFARAADSGVANA